MRTLIVSLVIVLTLTAVAQASRAPRPAERRALIAATKLYIDTSDYCSVITRIKVYGIRVSTVDQRWAVVHFIGRDESGGPVGPVSVALRKGNLTNRWAVRDLGTSDLGCDMPRRVRRDLNQNCGP